jgi:hypothetical protein
MNNKNIENVPKCNPFNSLKDKLDKEFEAKTDHKSIEDFMSMVNKNFQKEK